MNILKRLILKRLKKSVYFLNIILIALMTSLLSGCHLMNHIKSNDDQYLQARSVSDLQVPAGFNAVNIGNDFPIAPGAYPQGKSVSQLPPGH